MSRQAKIVGETVQTKRAMTHGGTEMNNAMIPTYKLSVLNKNIFS